MIVAVEAVKGGAAKSTTVVYTGEALAAAGLSVLVCDVDPQGTLLEWEAAAADDGNPLTVAVEGLPSAVMIRRRLPALAAKFDVTLIDCPNGDTGIIAAALDSADLAIVPMAPGIEEFRRGRAGMSLAERAGVPYRLLITLADGRTSILGEVLEAVDAERIPRFRTIVRRRAAIAVTVGARRPKSLYDYTDVAAELLEVRHAR